MFVRVGLSPGTINWARGGVCRVLMGTRWQVSGQLRRGFYSGRGSWGWQSASSNVPQDGSGQVNYKAVAAFQAKDREDPVYKSLAGKFSPTGEDNFFIRNLSPSEIYAGVADGVGGWAELGYDSSAISRELCRSMSDFSSEAGVSPKELIGLGYDKILTDSKVQVGGTTAIVAHFKPDGKLEVANLGDSWCGVFRNDQLVFQTKFQTVRFNAPYQLAVIPEQMVREGERKGRNYIRNKPSEADKYAFQLQKGDVIFLATDGVTDNVSTGDMELFLRDNHLLVDSDLQKASQEFVNKTVRLSKDPGFPSVFAQEASRLTGQTYTGGKEDDITLVVVKVE